VIKEKLKKFHTEEQSVFQAFTHGLCRDQGPFVDNLLLCKQCVRVCVGGEGGGMMRGWWYLCSCVHVCVCVCVCV
jgi:hypothetical protein